MLHNPKIGTMLIVDPCLMGPKHKKYKKLIAGALYFIFIGEVFKAMLAISKEYTVAILSLNHQNFGLFA